MNDEQIMNLKGHGSCGPSRIRLWAAVPTIGDDALLLNWDEPDNNILQTYSEAIGSPMLQEYGLTSPPGVGVWVFDGTVRISYYRSGDPLEPQDWDSDIEWEGEWRPPNDDEVSVWAAHEATDITDAHSGEGSAHAVHDIVLERPRPLSYKDGESPPEGVATAPYLPLNALEQIVHSINQATPDQNDVNP
ncbi:MAG: hypothetical protein AB7L09_02980 [Nitrospira sp.]